MFLLLTPFLFSCTVKLRLNEHQFIPKVRKKILSQISTAYIPYWM